MAIRGRRYLNQPLVYRIVYASPVPRFYTKWSRTAVRPPVRQIHLQNTIYIQGNTPGPPIATSYQWHRNLLPTRFTSRTAIVRAMAGVQPNATVNSFKQHRPAIIVQTVARRVSIVRAISPATGTPTGHAIYHRPQSISRPTALRRSPVTVVNPPVPQQINQRFDMHKLARQRTMIPMVYPNRRG